MAQKHLKELLKEDQEPFYLKDYIADRKCQLTKQAPKTKLQIKKSKPTSILCKNACFFSIQNSPDFRKSPKFFEFPPSPVPNKSPSRVFLHVPAKTAALLLDAAIRIQKHKSKPKTQIKNSGFGLFGSMLKRLNLRNRTQKLKSNEIKTEDENIKEEKVASISSSVSSSNSSYCNGRSSSMDLESSSSGRSFEDEEENDEFEFTNVLKESNSNNGDYFNGVCLSPLSPFRFALHKSPSPERRSPVFSSPAKSPVRCRFEEKAMYKHESLVKLDEEEDEDKEQNSPVSVLDPPFEDDYDGNEDEDNYDIDCSYAFVQRAKQELLHKLNRFEKLAELDPIELEKRMSEAEEEYALNQSNDEFQEYDCHFLTYDELTQQNHQFMQEVITKSGFQDVKKPGIKRLISDLIIEENCEEYTYDEQVIKRICKRLESWKEVESNTIDMMVEMDLKTDINWKNPQQEIHGSGLDIEVAIFAVLVDELVRDLV
ncbi:uncharacterized protein LOC130812758 [Amaranthus tricolor]|uniref:uncharacterized protein LOC130812758 n=1 Tax=Amaranthus tricolor TaxID=29722 RepID=UPI002586FBFC|nr:uncharacterized protein LOC130812758 [Amaranthus tricolor]